MVDGHVGLFLSGKDGDVLITRDALFGIKLKGMHKPEERGAIYTAELV